ncbi:MAG: glycoside hydrolase family 43 protein [Clostridia bacterium]|nr:glycoside hydrolase family 43 protein [Clostridia bacterium]
MRMIYNRLFCLFLSAVCGLASLFGIPDAETVKARQYEIKGEGDCDAGDGRVAVHDPSLIQTDDGTYYLFGTHGCAAKSTDLIKWESIAGGIHDSNPLLVPDGQTLREAFCEPLSWTDAYQLVRGGNEDELQTNIWAPDVIYNEAMGKYCYYASSSVWGTPGSVIWLATSDNIEGPYTYESAIVYSGFNNLTGKTYSRINALHYSFTNITELFKKGIFSRKQLKNAPWFNELGEYNDMLYPNCIDPQLFYDKDGRLWMTYGSFFGGIYLMPMVKETGLPDYSYMKSAEGYDFYFGKRIIATTLDNGLSGEGPEILYDEQSGYYYLFVSYAGLNTLGGYNVRQYRSKHVDGPYLDAKGNTALDLTNTGVKLFGNYKLDCLDKAYMSGGHSSTFKTKDGKLLKIYHTRFNNGSENYQTRIHQLAINKDDWAVMLPFEYKGEDLNKNSFTKDDICGEYEFINHGSITYSCEAWENAEKIIAPVQNITLNPNGTVTGLKLYESERGNTALSGREVSGKWSITDGTAYITLTVDKTDYKGVICLQKDESENETERLVFTALGSNNECVWAVKK